jgi:hypothetical protein
MRPMNRDECRYSEELCGVEYKSDAWSQKGLPKEARSTDQRNSN